MASLATIKRALYEGRSSLVPAWSSTWLSLHGEDAAETSDKWGFSFSVDWSNTFYILQPVTEPIVLERLHCRLQRCDLGIISIEELKGMGNAGLMSCSCPFFLHYAWCKHSCADAFIKEILTKYPKNMDPTVVQKRKVGRPASSQPKQPGSKRPKGPGGNA